MDIIVRDNNNRYEYEGPYVPTYCGNINIGKNSNVSSINCVECEDIVLQENSEIYVMDFLKKCGNIFFSRGARIGTANHLKEHGIIIIAPYSLDFYNTPSSMFDEKRFRGPHHYSYYLDNTKTYTRKEFEEEKQRIEAKIEQIYQATYKPPREDDIVFQNGQFTEDYERGF